MRSVHTPVLRLRGFGLRLRASFEGSAESGEYLIAMLIELAQESSHKDRMFLSSTTLTQDHPMRRIQKCSRRRQLFRMGQILATQRPRGRRKPANVCFSACLQRRRRDNSFTVDTSPYSSRAGDKKRQKVSGLGSIIFFSSPPPCKHSTSFRVYF